MRAFGVLLNQRWMRWMVVMLATHQRAAQLCPQFLCLQQRITDFLLKLLLVVCNNVKWVSSLYSHIEIH